MILTSFCLRPYETCFVDSVALVFLGSTNPLDPTFFTPSFHRIPRTQGNVWVGISACATISCWKNSLWWHLCWESIYDFRYESFYFFFLFSCIWFYPNSGSHQALVPGHPGSIRHWLPLTGWTQSLTSHWMFTSQTLRHLICSVSC